VSADIGRIEAGCHGDPADRCPLPEFSITPDDRRRRGMAMKHGERRPDGEESRQRRGQQERATPTLELRNALGGRGRGHLRAHPFRGRLPFRSLAPSLGTGRRERIHVSHLLEDRASASFHEAPSPAASSKVDPTVASDSSKPDDRILVR
jgi:hypothetical protein